MILTRNEILEEIKKKRIKIVPFNKNALGPASIDLTLGNELRIFTKSIKPLKIKNTADYKKVTKKTKFGKQYILRPGELVLGITKEKITLPKDICGWLNARSRFARLGLMIHISSPFMQPGISNRQVLEIYNAGPNKLTLIPGEKISQFVFQRCEGKAKYKGKFKNQKL